jgi:hypothetical protein
MSTAVNVESRIQRVDVSDETITAHLVDGRVISVPLSWSWRLMAVQKSEQNEPPEASRDAGTAVPDPTRFRAQGTSEGPAEAGPHVCLSWLSEVKECAPAALLSR